MLLFSKIDLIAIFFLKSDYDLIIISIIEYFFSLNMDFFINALLFSDDVISQKYNSNGKLSTLTSLVLSVLSNILSFIITYIIKKLTYYSETIELLT